MPAETAALEQIGWTRPADVARRALIRLQTTPAAAPWVLEWLTAARTSQRSRSPPQRNRHSRRRRWATRDRLSIGGLAIRNKTAVPDLGIRRNRPLRLQALFWNPLDCLGRNALPPHYILEAEPYQQLRYLFLEAIGVDRPRPFEGRRKPRALPGMRTLVHRRLIDPKCRLAE